MKHLVYMSLGDGGGGEDAHYCRLEESAGTTGNKLVKLSEDEIRSIDRIDTVQRALELYLNTDLPYITYQDPDLFALEDDSVKETELKVYHYSDALLEREVVIPDALGLKQRRNNPLTLLNSGESTLPGITKLVYEDYPYFQPAVEESEEYTNDAFYTQHVKPFMKLLEKRAKKLTATNRSAAREFTSYLKNLDLYQSPVEHAEYFTFSIYDFKDIFVDHILSFIVDIYAALIYKEKQTLREFFEDYDSEYSPVLEKCCFTSLKPIGSCGESPFAWGIFDKETQLLNKLWCHVEFVNLSTGVAEGYELVFGTKKRNFEKNKIVGSDFTKKSNFLKVFSKCVSICLNSKTRRFIITDYYWCACFEIEDVFDGVIEDARRFISNVKVRHFSYYNFEKDDKLTIRNIMASFFLITPKQSFMDSRELHKINTRVIKEWESFQASAKSPLIYQDEQQKRKNKRMKLSSFRYRSNTGLSFTKQAVDLEKSLIQFIAIGTIWSCQTLLIDIKTLFKDKSYLAALQYDGPKKVLLSIYDEYYQDPSISMLPRHFSENLKFGSTQVTRNTQDVYENWLQNVEAYNRLKPLQGDLLARMIDYGYLEDKPYNDQPDTHFKCDGYYIIYEPICVNNDELKPVDTKNEKHYEMAKAALTKIHEHGVTFSPNSTITEEILKVYNGKLHVINLEGVTSTGATPHNIKKDFAQLEAAFNKGPKASISTKGNSALMMDPYMADDFDDTYSTSDSGESLY